MKKWFSNDWAKDCKKKMLLNNQAFLRQDKYAIFKTDAKTLPIYIIEF